MKRFQHAGLSRAIVARQQVDSWPWQQVHHIESTHLGQGKTAYLHAGSGQYRGQAAVQLTVSVNRPMYVQHANGVASQGWAEWSCPTVISPCANARTGRVCAETSTEPSLAWTGSIEVPRGCLSISTRIPRILLGSDPCHAADFKEFTASGVGLGRPRPQVLPGTASESENLVVPIPAACPDFKQASVLSSTTGKPLDEFCASTGQLVDKKQALVTVGFYPQEFPQLQGDIHRGFQACLTQ